MKKASTVLVPVLVLGFWAAVIQSCASGETNPAAAGSGGSGDQGSGGADGSATGSGGSRSSSGGSTAASGGRTGSGGVTGSSGGTTGSSSGGKTGSGGSGTGGKTTSGSGGKTGSGGTTSSGTGGTVSTSSGGTTGTMTCTKQDATMTVNNGMATNGTWSGYAYTYVGSTPATISPTCGTTGTCFMTAAKQLCVSGTVGPDPSFGASAGFGWDIGAMATSGAAGQGGGGSGKPAIAPGGTGLNYNVPGITTSMRLQIEDAAGNDYCASVPTANSGTVPWGMFTQKCYNSPPGAAYSSSTKITSVQIVVPTTSGSMAYSFCFCVVSLGSG